MNVPDVDITDLLQQSTSGDAESGNALLARIYDDLRVIARSRLRHERADTMGTTALVHEAWLAMTPRQQANFSSRRHYYAYAATAMRHILVDRARRRAAGKRQVEVSAIPHHLDAPLELIAIDQALARLGELNPRLARVAEMRLFAGLSSDEIGSILDTTARTVERDWLKGRALLAQWLDAADA